MIATFLSILLLQSFAFSDCSLICQINKTKVKLTKLEMKYINDALTMYYADCGVYPNIDQGLDALLKAPEKSKYSKECKNWGPYPYIKRIPKDPWGRPFIYESNGSEFRLISLGSDRREGGEGFKKDIVMND